MRPASIWDYEDGNGVYDVPTRRDYERWEEEQRQKDRETAKNKPSDGHDIPY